jgi:hypothetical protein
MPCNYDPYSNAYVFIMTLCESNDVSTSIPIYKRVDCDIATRHGFFGGIYGSLDLWIGSIEYEVGIINYANQP